MPFWQEMNLFGKVFTSLEDFPILPSILRLNIIARGKSSECDDACFCVVPCVAPNWRRFFCDTWLLRSLILILSKENKTKWWLLGSFFTLYWSKMSNAFREFRKNCIGYNECSFGCALCKVGSPLDYSPNNANFSINACAVIWHWAQNYLVFFGYVTQKSKRNDMHQLD